MIPVSDNVDLERTLRGGPWGWCYRCSYNLGEPVTAKYSVWRKRWECLECKRPVEMLKCDKCGFEGGDATQLPAPKRPWGFQVMIKNGHKKLCPRCGDISVFPVEGERPTGDEKGELNGGEKSSVPNGRSAAATLSPVPCAGESRASPPGLETPVGHKEPWNPVICEGFVTPSGGGKGGDGSPVQERLRAMPGSIPVPTAPETPEGQSPAAASGGEVRCPPDSPSDISKAPQVGTSGAPPAETAGDIKEEISKIPGFKVMSWEEATTRIVIKRYRFHWRDGKTNDGPGTSPEQALTLLGFSSGALPALDYWEELPSQTAGDGK